MLTSLRLEMTEEERTSVVAQPEFLDFVEHSTKIIQRALNDNYDYVRDYTIGTETGPCVVQRHDVVHVLKHIIAVMTQRGVASNAYVRSMMRGPARTDPLQTWIGRRRCAA